MSSTQRALLLVAALCAASLAQADVYPSSVVGTDFDYITDEDPDAFKGLEFKGKGLEEMPDKSSEGPLRQEAFRFLASFSDGTQIALHVDADFGTEAKAKAEALRYTPRLGKLPTSLRRGVERVVVHKGNPDTTAFSDRGLIVVYSANATKRISTHDLEETIFHESVHAAWDGLYATSKEWLAAQANDGKFITRYARKNPKGEDLAESVLFAFVLIHHPERIPAAEAKKIRAAIPARIAFVRTLLPPKKPLTFPVGANYKAKVREAYRAANKRNATKAPEGKESEEQAREGTRERTGAQPAKGECPKKRCALETLDLSSALGISDILSNALMLGLKQEEARVQAFLNTARNKHRRAGALIKAAAQEFDLEETKVRAQVEAYLHCNCR
jgi:hypothetical protein